VNKHIGDMKLNFAPAPIGQMVEIALQQVQDEAQSNAPVRTGALRDSITHQMLAVTTGVCFVGVDYGAAQEFGFVTKQGAHIPGKNYFRPAAMHGKQSLLAMLKRYVQLNLTPGGAASARNSISGLRGKGGTSRFGHKYQFKSQTGAGRKYQYGKKRTTVTSYKFRGRPSIRQQRGGGRAYRGGAKYTVRRR